MKFRIFKKYSKSENYWPGVSTVNMNSALLAGMCLLFNIDSKFLNMFQVGEYIFLNICISNETNYKMERSEKKI